MRDILQRESGQMSCLQNGHKSCYSTTKDRMTDKIKNGGFTKKEPAESISLYEIWKLRRNTAEPHISRTYSLLQRFTFTSRTEFMNASYEEILEKGLAKLFSEGLGTVFRDDGKSVICFFTADLVDSKYSTAVNYFPHTGVKIAHTVDEVPLEDREPFLSSVKLSIQAMIDVAQKRGDHLRKIYIIQHMGPEENNPNFVSRTTNFPLHFHIYATLGTHIYNSSKNRKLFRDKSNFTFWDPTYLVVYDLLKISFPSIHRDIITSSITLKDRALDDYSRSAIDSIENSDMVLLSSVISAWKLMWHEVTACFTDFSVDKDGRYIPLPQDVRHNNINKFIEEHSELSQESKNTLIYVADNLKEAGKPQTKEEKYNFYKGINGSVGYTLDLLNGRVVLRFAPRTLVSEKYGATDGEFLRFRDRSGFLPKAMRESILEVQREIIAEINDIAKIQRP